MASAAPVADTGDRTTEQPRSGRGTIRARQRGQRPESFCGIAQAAALLGDTWTLLLLRELAGGPRRFTKLEELTGISPRVLTDRLRGLCERDMMTRHMYPEIPPRVEYELTKKGRAALPVLDALRTYGEQWCRPETQPSASHRPGSEQAH